MEGAGRRCAINFLSQMRGFFNHGYARHTSGDTKPAAVSTVPFGTLMKLIVHHDSCISLSSFLTSRQCPYNSYSVNALYDSLQR
ncbi:hypothetical protein D917_03645 [Trichinella nativa]|uniref:Uncharacterized protein n=1 Tax=Trichinella nativa TaxID=6335 RepID=A0A1Y3EBR8_9BILA|nr:hypothetical protein D917_03645 [Trichinella nativa]